VPAEKREEVGLQRILHEVFPIENEAKGIRLEFVDYRFGKPRYLPEQCLQLRLTYGRPFYIRVRLHKQNEVIEEDVYLGEMPVMLGGGEFIINGAERVIVTQLHRSPGCDFSREQVGDRVLHSCRIIPARGSWIEMEVNRRDCLTCQLDQSGKIPITLVLRALKEAYGTDEALLKVFYDVETVKFTEGTAGAKLRDRVSAVAVTVGDEAVKLVEAGQRITEEAAQQLAQAGVKQMIPFHVSPKYSANYEQVIQEAMSAYQEGSNKKRLSKKL
jgi:DNA-directed RNA polymerase subunit beta